MKSKETEIVLNGKPLFTKIDSFNTHNEQISFVCKYSDLSNHIKGKTLSLNLKINRKGLDGIYKLTSFIPDFFYNFVLVEICKVGELFQVPIILNNKLVEVSASVEFLDNIYKMEFYK